MASNLVDKVPVMGGDREDRRDNDQRARQSMSASGEEGEIGVEVV
jgi:hypothetical protein